MGYRLGVDLGTTFTAAVVHRPESGTATRAVVLGEHAAAMPSVLFLGDDGTVLMGEAAERRTLTDPDRVVRQFKRRIGDETPLLVGPGGEGLTAHAIAARMIALVADRVAEQEGGPPEAVAVTVPAGWAAHKKELLTTALMREGLLGVTLVSEPVAAAVAYARAGRLGSGTTVAVYDFGGGTFDAAVLRAHSDIDIRVLGAPSGLSDLGGIDLDDAVLAYVLGTAGPQTPGVDPDDPLHVRAMARLRRGCVEAKEALSSDSAVTVPVLLSGAQTSVRLTRGDFEAMIAGAIEETCIALEATLVSAGLTGKNLGRILLVGGSSRIPLVTQLLSSRYPGVALERGVDPKLAVAAGGVLALEQARQAEVAIAKPARPALELTGFERERGPEVHAEHVARAHSRRRKAPRALVAGAGAGVLVFGGLGLSQFGTPDLGEPLPAAVHEAQANSDGKPAGLTVEAVRKKGENAAPRKKAKAPAVTESSSSSEAVNASTTPVAPDNSAKTERGSTEGSSLTRSAESSGTAGGSDAGAADAKSGKAGRATATKDQASVKREAARDAAAAPAGGASTAAAPAAQSAAQPAAQPEAQPATDAAAPQEPVRREAAPAQAEGAARDSGSVEFKDGGPGVDAP